MATTFQGSSLAFDPFSLKSAGVSSDYSGAANAVSMPANFQAQRTFGPDFDGLSSEVMKNRAMVNIAGIEGAANTVSAGLSAFGTAKGQLLQAQAYENAAEEQRKAASQSAGIGALGGVLSTGLSLLAGPAAPAVNAAVGIGGAAIKGFS
jgi:hypothetical protein